ncbi:MAG: Lrp/AsnC ligand binding domain-containing protein [Thermoprotei archaeon]
MVEAFVFVSVEPGKIDRVGMDIKRFPNVMEVFAVTGEYDIVVRVEAKDFAELSRIIREYIPSVSGVIKTSTSVIIEKY